MVADSYERLFLLQKLAGMMCNHCVDRVACNPTSSIDPEEKTLTIESNFIFEVEVLK
jgi:hypothetical protein